jgi:drug/metabolite transporter (DMT)-like permease
MLRPVRRGPRNHESVAEIVSPGKNSSDKIPLTGALLLVLLCLTWGGNLVSIKFSNQGVPPIMAATIRSVVSSLLLWLYCRAIGEAVFLPSRLMKHGVAIGILFGAEFLVLYWGMSFTDASRAVIFIYTHPLWVALMAHFILHDDRLNVQKSIGAFLAFVGLIAVFGSRSATLGPLHWVGDAMELTAGFMWAATTVYIKKFIWNQPVTHYQTLFVQLFFSIPVLVAGVVLFEWGAPVSPTPLVVGVLVYQSVIVAFISYLAWFWMIHRFQVSRLTAFTYLTPLCGVVLSGIVLGETLTIFLWVGFTLAAGGIYLVNRS